MQDIEQKAEILSVDNVHDISSSDEYESSKGCESYANSCQTPQSHEVREACCTPLDLKVQPEANPSWASEMSLYDRMPAQRSMECIKIPLTPEAIPTPKEFMEGNWNMMSGDQSKHIPNVEQIGSYDAISVKELRTRKEKKGSGLQISLNRTEYEEKVEIKNNDLVEEEFSLFKPSSITSSQQSKPSSNTYIEQSGPLPATNSEQPRPLSTTYTEQSSPLSTPNSELSYTQPIFDYKNLLVNYLPPDMDSKVLRSLFVPYGTIVSCKVVVNHKSGLSKGYGFVKFKSAEDGIKAQKALDRLQIGRKTLKVSFSRQERRKERTKQKNNLYLSNLDPRMESGDLERHLKICEYVVQCRVLKSAQGVSKQIGFVRFNDAKSARRAINMFDGQQLEGTDRPIKIRIAGTPRASRKCDAFHSGSSNTLPNSSVPVHSDSSVCYVKGFHWSLSENVLRKIFEPDGGRIVKSIRIIRRKKSPYAFINFFNCEDAADAAYECNNTNLGKRVITVRLQE